MPKSVVLIYAPFCERYFEQHVFLWNIPLLPVALQLFDFIVSRET